MTVEQALTKIADEFDDLLLQALLAHSDLLHRLDVDEDDITRLLVRYRDELAESRARTLIEIEGVLRRGGEVLH